MNPTGARFGAAADRIDPPAAWPCDAFAGGETVGVVAGDETAGSALLGVTVAPDACEGRSVTFFTIGGAGAG